MKKQISIFLSVMILLCSLLMTSSAFAKNDIISPETTTPHIHVVVTLNGKDSDDISYEVVDAENGIIHIKYTGSGHLIGWEFKHDDIELAEGVEYEIIKQDSTSITIQILPQFKGDIFWANAIDDKDNETTNPAKKDENQKSPNTGDAFTITACAVGIGSALLVARKRRK